MRPLRRPGRFAWLDIVLPKVSHRHYGPARPGEETPTPLYAMTGRSAFWCYHASAWSSVILPSSASPSTQPDGRLYRNTTELRCTHTKASAGHRHHRSATTRAPALSACAITAQLCELAARAVQPRLTLRRPTAAARSGCRACDRGQTAESRTRRTQRRVHLEKNFKTPINPKRLHRKGRG